MNIIEINSLSKCYSGQAIKIAGSGWARLLDFINPKKNPDRHLTKDIWALQDISLQVPQSQVLGIIGRNGAGKTTLLKILARVTAPSSGSAVIRGRVVSLLELGVGFQPDLTARENIFLNTSLYGLSRQEVKKRFDEIISFAGLEKFTDAPLLKHFSSGMYLRLAFSVAINMTPDVLLADEVLAVGDLDFQKKCIERMHSMGERGTTVLFVSHDMEAIRRLCTRCIRLDEGKIVDEGRPEDVTARYEETVWSLSAKSSRDIEGKHINDYGEILSVDIVNAQKSKVAAVDASGEFSIRIVFRAFAGRLKVRFGYDLVSDGKTLFRTVQPRDFFVNCSGVYTSFGELPVGLLVDKIYKIHGFVILLENEKGVINRVVKDFDAISFRPYQTGDPYAGLGDFVKPSAMGTIRPEIEWEEPAGEDSLEKA